MQQFCNNCGAPISAGMSSCARCGAPVSSGSGSYDPTIRAGGPPGSGYGQQPYGPPPIDPYGGSQPQSGFGAPPPPPPGYGAQPQSGFGAPPPPPPGFGPPPQPAFGAPPGVGYGGPQQPFMAPQPKKSKTWIYVVVGIVIVVLLACGGVAFAINRLANTVNNALTSFDKTATAQAQNPSPNPTTPASGTHISNVQVGSGDSQGHITNQTTSFSTSDTIVIIYTVTTQDSGAQVVLNVVDSSTGNSIGTNGPQAIDVGTNKYYFAFSITGTGSYTGELQYNGTTEQNVNFTVS